jgi:hypothetical protein
VKKFVLPFCVGLVVGLGAGHVANPLLHQNATGSPAVIIDNWHNQSANSSQQVPSNLPHSQWPADWLRTETFMNANQSCQAKIKTKTFNPETIHWDGNHPTKAYFEQVHVISWNFDPRNDYGTPLYWMGV